MKKPALGLRILAGLFEIVFVFVFILSAIITPAIGTANGILNGDTITKAIESLELGDLFYEAFQEQAGEDVALEYSKYFDTEFANEVLTTYADSVVKAIKGEEYINVNSKYISQVFDSHQEEMYGLLFEQHPELKNTSGAKKEFKSEVCSVFELLPAIDELVEQLDISNETLLSISYLDKANTIAIVVTIVLAILIIVISLYKGNGFVWLAAGLFLPMIVSLLIGYMDVTAVTSSVSTEVTISESLVGIVSEFVSGLAISFKNAGLIYLGAFIICIILKVAMVKKANRKEDNDPLSADYEYI